MSAPIYAASHNVGSFAQLSTAIADGDASIDITITASFDFTATLTIPAGKTVTITSDTTTRTLTRSTAFTDRFFTVHAGASLTLNHIVLDGNKENVTATAPIIFINNSGSLTLNSGAVLQNNAASSGSGVHNAGTFTMNAGEISGNTSKFNGGGVYNSGTFTMKGGKISGNILIKTDGFSSYGGGVCNFNGTFTMESGEISGNTADDYGGGVYSAGTFTMEGGEIKGNTSADDGGGGVYNNNIFTMKDGKIYDNTGAGGGVFNDYDGTFMMDGGEISSNTGPYSGGGVYNRRTFIMNAGKIFDNKALDGFGGGVYTVHSGSTSDVTFTMNGGEISGNTATNSGGGVYNICAFIMNAGVISGNTASNGGGVFTGGVTSTFTMKGGKIFGNAVSGGLGNGIYFYTGSVTLGGTAEIGDALGNGNGIYLNKNMIIGILTNYTGFANIEGVNDAVLGRPVVKGDGGYVAQETDIAKFGYLPSDFVLVFDGENDQIVLGTLDNPPITYKLNVNAGTGGTVSGTASSSYEEGTAVSVTATAAKGYHFVGWTVNGVTLTNPDSATATFNMPAGVVTLTANFEKDVIPPTPQNPNAQVPTTGDSGIKAQLAWLSILSLLGLCAMTFAVRRRRNIANTK